MKIIDDQTFDFGEVLIHPKKSPIKSRNQVNLKRKFKFKHSNTTWEGVPILASNMDGVGSLEMWQALSYESMITCLTKTIDDSSLIEALNEDKGQNNKHLAVSVGVNQTEIDKVKTIWQEANYHPEFICIDIANGYMTALEKTIESLRNMFPSTAIIAGNVVDGKRAVELLQAGADIIKIGIGSGSACTTRIKTGCGSPQLSSVGECVEAVHEHGGHVISDGGCVCPGDVAKAFAVGADFVMLGNMLAGHSEGGGNIVVKTYKSSEVEVVNDRLPTLDVSPKFITKSFVEFYGMSSFTANNKHFGGLKNYRTSEGRSVLIPFKGPVKNTIEDILGGLRSACSYVGADTLEKLYERSTFVRAVTQYNKVFENNEEY